MDRLSVLELEGQKVREGKYYCVGFAYKDTLLKAIILNPEGQIFPVDYHKVVLKSEEG